MPLKVVFVDPLIRGHHIVHAVYACEWFIATGHEVTFIAWNPHPALEPLASLPMTMIYAGNGIRDDDGIDQHTLRGQFRMRRVIRRAIDEAKRHDADVVHLLFLDWFLIGLLTALAFPPLGRGRARLYAALYWTYFDRPAGEKRPVVMKVKYWLERRILRALISPRGIEALFVFSDETRNRLMARGVDTTRMAVIPDPVDVPSAVPEPQDAREEIGLPRGDRLFLFFGETRLDKGPDILLAALPLVRGKCTVVFVGPPNGLVEEEFVQAKRTLPDHVHLVWRLERVPDADVAAFFAAADCVVLPYRRLHLGTSGAMQHAAAYGRPIIVSDVGVLGDIARRHDLGLVVEPESPIALAKAIDAVVAMPVTQFERQQEAARRYGAGNDWRVFGEQMRERFAADAERRGRNVPTRERQDRPPASSSS